MYIMGHHLMYQLIMVCVLAAMCLCTTTLSGATTRLDRLESIVEELSELVTSYMRKVEAAEAENTKPYSIFQAPNAGPPGPPGPAGLPGIFGRDGRDGEDGTDGRDGEDGTDGKDGEDGKDGKDGENGKDGRDGNDGQPGAPGAPGATGVPGPVGLEGPVGPKGGTGEPGGGAVYTRWGRTTCGANSTVIYDGFTAMSRYDQPGGGVNFQCMVFDAEYNKYNSISGGSIAGTEYQSDNYGIFEDAAFQQNAPCAVCYANNRPSVLMIPGKRTCPSDTWQKEYEGYLMTEHEGHSHQTTFECVDADPEFVPGEQADNNGGLFYFNTPVCDKGVNCPPYYPGTAITCVVCTM